MAAEETEQQRVRLSLAALCFSLVAPATYLLERLYERLRGGPHNPQLIISEAKAGFYWRAILATWWAILLAILFFRLLRDDPENGRRITRRLTWALILLFPVALFWAWRFP